MITNLEKYRKDLKILIDEGDHLLEAMYFAFTEEAFREELERALKKDKDKIAEYLKKLPSFHSKYQTWYSEALVMIKQLLPDRVSDFKKQYEKPITKRKDITYENYVIEDSLHGLHITRGWEKEKIVGADAGIPRFQQQLNIVKAINKRFESSLFDIKQLVQADLFDSELETAKELNKKGFVRGAGAVAGVVLEKHLLQVCDNHSVAITKKHPGISDLNDLLKSVNVIDVPVWRSNQHLSDLRNLCDHNKKVEPTKEQIDELISGAEKITKTLF